MSKTTLVNIKLKNGEEKKMVYFAAIDAVKDGHLYVKTSMERNEVDVVEFNAYLMVGDDFIRKISFINTQDIKYIEYTDIPDAESNEELPPEMPEGL